jgi:hypothetical protein
MMVYPSSYMIYSKGFDGLPTLVKKPVSARMWDILTGCSVKRDTRRCRPVDRKAVMEILRDTKSDLPHDF